MTPCRLIDFMPEKEYKCAYTHCLHHGQGVKESEAVVLGNKHYHADCAKVKQEIQDMARFYVESTDDEKQFPVVMRVLNTLVFNNGVPPDFIKTMLEHCMLYYSQNGVMSLYSIRKEYWEKEFKA